MPAKKGSAKTKALTKADVQTLPSKTGSKKPWTQQQVDLMTRTVAKGASLDELHLFLYTANKVGLDPLVKQIYFVKRKETVTIQVGIDGLRAIAERTGQLAGIDEAIYDYGKAYEPGKEPTNPTLASVTVYRMVNGQRVPFVGTARWKEFKPAAPNDFMWKKMPYNQLAKCAESAALRKGFPNDLSGLYIHEEMEQAGEAMDVIDVGSGQAEIVDRTPKKEAIPDIEAECHGCAQPITKAVADYSVKMFGKPACAECQKSLTKK